MSGHGPPRTSSGNSASGTAQRTGSGESACSGLSCSRSTSELWAAESREASPVSVEASFAYFSSFVPSFVTAKVMEDAAGGSLPESKKMCPKAEHEDAVVYLVDISGFSKLADRFCHTGSREQGVDKFSSIVNSLVSEIVEHVNSWGGDIIRFVGDCVIVVWKAKDVKSMPGILRQAVHCALELERLLGTFVVPCQGQSFFIAEELANLPESDASPGLGAERSTQEWGECEWGEYLELLKQLRGVPALGRMDKKAIMNLGRHIRLGKHNKDDIIAVSDLVDLDRTVFIVHSGILEYSAKCSAKGQIRWQGSGGHVSSLGTLQEGELFTMRGLYDRHGLESDENTIAVFAKADCVISQVKVNTLESITGKALAELVEVMPQGNTQSDNIILRVHQAISCGKVWFAHMGGEAVNEALGPRREFLVVGDPILEASEALNEAVAGDLVVGKSCKPYLSSAYTHTATATGHLKIISAGPHQLRVDVMPPPSIGSLPQDMAAPVCELLRSYCHEGSRQLCGQAENLVLDVRQITVIFFKMHINLEATTSKTLETINASFATIQGSVQSNQGTILQFVQDDKGLIVVACFSYAPFSTHSANPLRATLATMKIQQGLLDLGVPVSIGVTTGSAFAGFAGNDRRRQQCVMGSTVNMAASLMCNSDTGILVDVWTWTEASVCVQFRELPSIKAKGQDTPMRVFRPVRTLSEREIQNNVVDIARSSNIITDMDKALPLLQKLVSEKKHKCTVKFVLQTCKYLQQKLESFDHLPQHEAKRHLISLCRSISKSKSAINLFNSSDHELLGSTELCYTQSLAKVALFISHAKVFPKELAKKVFCKSFGVDVPVFEKAFAQLRKEHIIRPIMPFEVFNYSGTVAHYCPDCVPWMCLGGTVCVHAHLLAHKDDDNFVFVKEGQDDVQEHCSQPVEYNRKAWSRISAEWYERDKKLDLKSGPVQMLLALKYEGALEKVEKGAKFDQEMALKASYYLSCAAQAAEEAMSFKAAIDMLQRAFNLLEHISDSAGGQTKVAIVKKIHQLCNDNVTVEPPSPMSYVSAHSRLSQTAQQSLSRSSMPVAGSPGTSKPASPSASSMSPSAHLLNPINRRVSMLGSSPSSPIVHGFPRQASRGAARCTSEMKRCPEPDSHSALSTMSLSGSFRGLAVWQADFEKSLLGGEVEPAPSNPLTRNASGSVAQHSAFSTFLSDTRAQLSHRSSGRPTPGRCAHGRRWSDEGNPANPCRLLVLSDTDKSMSGMESLPVFDSHDACRLPPPEVGSYACKERSAMEAAQEQGSDPKPGLLSLGRDIPKVSVRGRRRSSVKIVVDCEPELEGHSLC
mmetsp:Transcript_16221/g.39541  ORF Transcript_16221/g.39541 Transcript_16221/m.39541 type:complete len:1322 (+) Transcript_16221:84-4049(+)|eukprot:CAMPEP_0206233932 /NCGR_PEP_ID=MMETSP0047_2-20121206/12292_1 /ASSEMBLY_ACC=CAM_ASM_000192 /TAXON_ID=195065 /ORGANISM="Chroomonas mesostigmatica_cf, Strain CCMP1168" /LENGTH=1321 /DNA_ID=CAMNT_0053657927 /DNA_START=84 /DNA_END=4049 /DNA_ORIENTATION=+